MCYYAEMVTNLINEKSNPGTAGIALVLWVNMKRPLPREVFPSFILYFSYDTHLVL